MGSDEPARSPSLSELPLDELIHYGRSLGLMLSNDTPQGEALRLVRDRQELLIELERDALLDVVVWLRSPVRRTANKEQLAAVIAQHEPARYDGLSDRGLRAIGALRGLTAEERETRADLEIRLRRMGGPRARWRRARRWVVGHLVDRLVKGQRGPQDGEHYRFLPEEDASPSLREEIEQTGLVGGVARKLKGAADDYIKTARSAFSATRSRTNNNWLSIFALLGPSGWTGRHGTLPGLFSQESPINVP